MKKLVLLILILFLMELAYAVNIDNVETIKLEPGKSGTINLDVENDHDFDVKELSISLDFSGEIPIAPYYSSAGAFIGDLDEGDDESLSFGVIASADAELGLYKIPVLISYKDETDQNYEQVDFIGILIESKPNIGVILDDPNYLVGDGGEVSVKVINRGLSKIKFLRVELLNSDFYDLLSSDEVYIGDLDSDDFDSAEFNLNLNYPLPSNIKLPVKITYYDSNNNLYEKRFDLSTKVYDIEEAKRLGLVDNKNYNFIFILIGAAIFIFVVYKIIRRKRK